MRDVDVHGRTKTPRRDQTLTEGKCRLGGLQRDYRVQLHTKRSTMMQRRHFLGAAAAVAAGSAMPFVPVWAQN
ncbi:MAG: twin-arginine translocation signal domain-containing protein, partial [Burkholderiaceae bacterium]|nr:twin-arginine translocation signal domain-containing protein [Burkholderiaceae bacterium]